VEDNLDAVHSMAVLIKMMGHECQFAINGFAAIDIARWFRPEVVLLDIGLPDFDGCDIASQLKWEPGLENTRIIAITALPEYATRDRALKAGCEAFYQKPIDPIALAEILEKSFDPKDYASAIRQAAAECGGEEVLARHLDVPVDEIRRWTSGTSVPPLRKFFVALVLGANCGKRH
jgi:CheY-like chemotaxis protein